MRYVVGEDREDALLNAYTKLHSNLDKIPATVSNWIVKPLEIDDVPTVMLSLWSSQPDRYSDFKLRRFADGMTTSLQQIEDTNQVNIESRHVCYYLAVSSEQERRLVILLGDEP